MRGETTRYESYCPRNEGPGSQGEGVMSLMRSEVESRGGEEYL